MDEKIVILGVPFNKITHNEALEKISDWLASSGQKHIATPNPEFLLEAQKNDYFKNILNKTHLNIPDGIGILWAATYLFKTLKNKSRFIKILKGLGLLGTLLLCPAICKKVLKERVAGTDLMASICEKVAQTGHKIFLLGAALGIAEKTAQSLALRFPSLKIVGIHAGFPEEIGIIEKINNSGADVLFVAFGAPKQEKWIHENLSRLPNIKIAIGVGGAFDFLAGKLHRAPSFMRKIGLEWLVRLFQEPKRIRRIFNAVIKFPLTVFKKH
ncbi:WecB/TagA/CpsF family glycosyltransferase [Candidatus Peregrinibacteria bacterium]|nr:WecB/TagA/CpsF family glycosyltransferase [Candidatus Peregrinibacteria bacterium]